VLDHLEPGHVRSPFADLTQALTPAHGGAVRFRGRSWADMAAPGRGPGPVPDRPVFDVGGWVSNLTVEENVLLARRHFAAAPAVDLRRRADELARSFGLPDGVPRKRPAVASQFELRLSQWARALLGDVDLLVLERPTKDVRPEAVPPFLAAVRAARDRGTAVLWVTTDGAGPGTPHNIAPADVTARYAVRGTGLVSVPVG
jgi:ABC-type multidrug transport system ATPase subunit